MLSRICLLLAAGSDSAALAAPLSLDDAIRHAWAHDPVVATLALTPELARAREEQAGVRPNPEVEFRGSTPTPFRNDSEWSLGIGVSQRLPRRDRVEQARALARLGGETAAHALREQQRLVAGEVRRLYYEIVVLQARGESARRTAELQEAARALLQRRSAAGEVSAAELDFAATESLRAAQAVALADAELAAAQHRLRARLRLPPAAGILVTLDLGTLLTRPLPAEPADLDAVRPALALAAHRVREADATLALARKESRGDWTVGVGFDFERRANDLDGRLENEPRLSASASVPWPRTVSNRGDIREKQAALRIAEAELAARRDELRAEVAATLAATRTLQPVLQAQWQTLRAAARPPADLQTTYERGETSGVQLAQARLQRLALETEFLQAAARYAGALADAETAVGLLPALP